MWRGAGRQLILGAVAAALTFGIGHLVGGAVT
jgi:VIT1/CCC1 family predicted Fe2+/Mn2+ transporter